MPLEDLTGSKFIADLNENWPAGTDYPDAGDDHIRGVKNVLKRQFPNLGRVPVTATAAQLVSGGVPIGSVMIFYQSAPPTGWKRSTIDATRALRVVATATAGGGSGGTDDPVLNDKVPAHLHPLSITSAAMNANASHNHVAGSNWAGDHTHNVTARYGTINDQIAPVAGTVSAGDNESTGVTTVATTSAGGHAHTVTVNASNIDHTHNLTGNTQNNASAANWAPRYIDVIVCERES